MEINKIYNIDCFAGMRQMIKQRLKVDAIITDPPYGTIKGIESHLWNGDKSKTYWDNAFDPNKIYFYANKLLREKGTLILFSQEPYTSKLRTSTIPNLPFTQSAIWEKEHFGNPLSAKNALLNYHEDISIFRKKHDYESNKELREYAKKIREHIGLRSKEINKTLGHARAQHFLTYDGLQFRIPTEKTYNELIIKFGINKLDFFIPYQTLKEMYKGYQTFNLPPGKNHKGSIFKYKKDTNKLHPTQKPLALMEDLITTYTNEGETVLDFTIGSGTTCVACIRTNRNYIGFELDEKYYNIAVKRINEEKKRLRY